MTGAEALKKVHPGISWAVIIAALGLGGNAMYSANAVENLALANEKDIFYEREIRTAGAAVLEENFEDLKEDVKDIKQEIKEESSDIKELLNQLLLKQALETATPNN